MLDIVMLALIIAAWLGAAGYARACLGLMDSGPPPEGPAR